MRRLYVRCECEQRGRHHGGAAREVSVADQQARVTGQVPRSPPGSCSLPGCRSRSTSRP